MRKLVEQKSENTRGVWLMKRIPARPGIYNGHQYQSQLEIKMARILDKNKIEFRPHIQFEVENGKIREVDVMLETLIKPIWSSEHILAIEVKGRLDKRDWTRLKELEKIGIPVFIATQPIIEYWERESFLEFRLYERKALF